MKYGSVCSGIEAATQAWHPLGWEPAFFSEIEKFPSAVLAERYGSNMPGEPLSENGVPNYGDMTKFKEWTDHGQQSERPIDLLVGGTPCQSFSIAGLRKGLTDPRGNLMLTFGAIAERYKPQWFIWENVPGVLSSNGGRDFAAFIRLMGECGYGVAYRVLDTQHVRTQRFRRAIPQRRRRVFVVGYLGDWRVAAAVLFDGESLSGNNQPRRQTREATAVHAGRCVESGDKESIVAPVASTLNAAFGDKLGLENQYIDTGHPQSQSQAQAIAIEDGREIEKNQNGLGVSEKGCSYTLNTMGNQAVAFSPSQHGQYKEGAGTLRSSGGDVGGGYEILLAEPRDNWSIRRLTPVECERLQGFPDNHTKIPWRGKEVKDCPDGHRYKALGNSMSVNVMEWLGTRIELIEAKTTALIHAPIM